MIYTIFFVSVDISTKAPINARERPPAIVAGCACSGNPVNCSQHCCPYPVDRSAGSGFWGSS